MEQVTKPKKPKVRPLGETTPGASTPASAGTAAQKAPAATPSEIQAAKTSGKVWVNTASGVYHKSGKWYGTTKQGKFMTEDEAAKAGYRPAKNEGK